MRNLIAVLGLGLLIACQDKGQGSQNAAPSAEDLKGQVLATVGGEEIRALDLDLAIERTLGSSVLVPIDDQARQKILESLVMSKSLAQKKRKELDANSLAAIESQVDAYRDELLTKMYLKENVAAAPVTAQMVEKYYRENLHQYGATQRLSYEVIQAKGPLSGNERKAILAALNTANQQEDWQALVKRWQAEKLKVTYSTGSVEKGRMAPDFERVLKSLQQGETSDVFFMRKMPAIVRVTQVTSSPAKPLVEVSTEIRKQLAPVQLKKAIRKAADDVMQNANIVYPTTNDQ